MGLLKVEDQCSSKFALTQVKNPQVEGDSHPSEGYCALLLGLAVRKADLGQPLVFLALGCLKVAR